MGTTSWARMPRRGPDGKSRTAPRLTNLSGAVASIAIQAPGGFAWATEPDPTGAALAEYFPSTTAGQGDVYINPQVKSDLPPPGGTLPLGGSTGSLIQLANGMPLTVTIHYQGQSTPALVDGNAVSGTVSATNPMPATLRPVERPWARSRWPTLGQDGTGQSYEQGYVHLVVTAPAGVTFDAATFGEVSWTLSDSSAYEWDSTAATVDHNHIYATLRAGTANVADLYFPPVSDEAPASGSTAPTMLLQVDLPGSSQVDASPFAGTDVNLTLLTEPINAEAPPAPPTTEAEFRADLASTSPEYDTIDLPAGQTITITQPIEITHSVHIVGNGRLRSTSTRGARPPWPASASGAPYVSATRAARTSRWAKRRLHRSRSMMSQPIRWSNPAGVSPSLWDPENNQGITHAVIDTRDSNSNENRDIVTLDRCMTSDGPRLLDGLTYAGLQAHRRARRATRAMSTSAWRPAIDTLVRTQRARTAGRSPAARSRGARSRCSAARGPSPITRCSASAKETYSPAAA